MHHIQAVFVRAFFCLLVLGSSSASVRAEAPAVLLAEKYADGLNIHDYWVSEKYDGVRAYWDGRQLLSRNGNAFFAPAWFTKNFPQQALDGELWIGRGKFAATLSAVSKHQAIDSEWRRVQYLIFELPNAQGTFTERIVKIKNIVAKVGQPHLLAVPQFRLADQAALMTKLDEVVALGAEGLMLHRAQALYRAGRSDDLLKLKPYQDAEATVLAHIVGKGKYSKMMGALLLETKDGLSFKLGTGFSDAERKNPPPIGSQVTYKFHGRTKNGLPRFASFLRRDKRP